ncbi:MAG: hypothetical protein QG597_3476 [Actinomycetota bacterium]|nr:hypothetical protein [Actinomycetota bacterium]
MTDERNLEDELLRPQPQWYYKLITGEVTQDPGPDRMGPYSSRKDAHDALALARKRNDEWDEQDDEWNGKK